MVDVAPMATIDEYLSHFNSSPLHLDMKRTWLKDKIKSMDLTWKKPVKQQRVSLLLLFHELLGKYFFLY